MIFNSARLVRKGEELEHYHPEPVEPKSGPGSRHDASGQIDCRLEGSRLIVSDHGPGFAKEALEMLFATEQRGKSLTGHGLGLAIVQHVCNACGWGLAATNRPAGGAEIHIDFGTSLTRP